MSIQSGPTEPLPDRDDVLRPMEAEILMKQYELVWANIRHNETVRDHMYNFYLIAYSFLMLGAFQLAGIRRGAFPDLPRTILFYPFIMIAVVGATTIAIQARLRMVLDRDGLTAKAIREKFVEYSPLLREAFEVQSAYFERRWSSGAHRAFNVNRLIIYLVLASELFSVGMGGVLSAVGVRWTCIALVACLVVCFAVMIAFEGKPSHEPR